MHPKYSHRIAESRNRSCNHNSRHTSTGLYCLPRKPVRVYDHLNLIYISDRCRLHVNMFNSSSPQLAVLFTSFSACRVYVSLSQFPSLRHNFVFGSRSSPLMRSHFMLKCRTELPTIKISTQRLDVLLSSIELYYH